MTKTDAPEDSYRVVTSCGNIQIRDYFPRIIAEVQVEGDRRSGIRQGFKMLADYIFGGNFSSEKIAMTAPVIQQKHGQGWKVRFVLPQHYTLDNAPQPCSADVQLRSFPARRCAAIRFSGRPNDRDLHNYQEVLHAYLVAEGLDSQGEPLFAFYNPPWTLPFLRRNEVIIEIGTDLCLES